MMLQKTLLLSHSLLSKEDVSCRTSLAYLLGLAPATLCTATTAQAMVGVELASSSASEELAPAHADDEA